MIPPGTDWAVYYGIAQGRTAEGATATAMATEPVVDQYQYQYAPPRRPEAEPAPPPEAPPVPPTREQISAAACAVATQLGAGRPEALSCLAAKLSDAKQWLPVSGPEDAPVWLVIVRAAVAVPQAGGGVYRGNRLEVAVDARSGRALGFRVPN